VAHQEMDITLPTFYTHHIETEKDATESSIKRGSPIVSSGGDAVTDLWTVSSEATHTARKIHKILNSRSVTPDSGLNDYDKLFEYSDQLNSDMVKVTGRTSWLKSLLSSDKPSTESKFNEGNGLVTYKRGRNDEAITVGTRPFTLPWTQ